MVCGEWEADVPVLVVSEGKAGARGGELEGDGGKGEGEVEEGGESEM